MAEPTVTAYPGVEVKFYEKGHYYEVNGRPADGVTSVLGKVFDRSGPMAWWGQEVGIAGVQRLLARHPVVGLLDAEPKTVAKLLTESKLTVNHQRDRAASRGTDVHAAAELYAQTGELPDPQVVPEEQRGYVTALVRWIKGADPEFLGSEVVVGSAEHSYAGTYDMRVAINGRIGLGDFKTSKRLYDSVFAQLEAYEIASIECGLGETDFRFAVRLGADGEYEYEESQVSGVWLPLLQAYRAQKEIATARKAA